MDKMQIELITINIEVEIKQMRGQALAEQPWTTQIHR